MIDSINVGQALINESKLECNARIVRFVDYLAQCQQGHVPAVRAFTIFQNFLKVLTVVTSLVPHLRVTPVAQSRGAPITCLINGGAGTVVRDLLLLFFWPD